MFKKHFLITALVNTTYANVLYKGDWVTWVESTVKDDRTVTVLSVRIISASKYKRLMALARLKSKVRGNSDD